MHGEAPDPRIRWDHIDRSGGPTVLRIVLGTQLRKLREAKGISREEAGEYIRASHAKISRLELGRVGLKERDVEDLLTLYGVTDDNERKVFLDLVNQARQPGWWHRYNDLLPNWFELYLRLEQESSYIRCFDHQTIPGLLQTEDYARNVIRFGHGSTTRDELERRVHLRLNRQKVLTQPGAPRFWAVVDEAALRRPIGGPETMRAQYKHILNMVEHPNITLQILPFERSGYAVLSGSFTILRFNHADLPDLVYIEQLTSSVYHDKRNEVEPYLSHIERITIQALTPTESIKFLQQMIKELE